MLPWGAPFLSEGQARTKLVDDAVRRTRLCRRNPARLDHRRYSQTGKFDQFVPDDLRTEAYLLDGLDLQQAAQAMAGVHDYASA